MKPYPAIERMVRQTRPSAKFIAVSHSSEFIDPAADLGDGFYTANLYDERIDANMLVSRHGRVMIQNTYIASFAYNLFLCWIYCHRQPGKLNLLDALLVHNFKKLFAEQLYRRINRIPSRALLLETLLFEQQQMVEPFAAKTGDQGLAADADAAANLMSFALSMHELGHYYLATKPGMWPALLEAEPDTVGRHVANLAPHHPPAFLTEFHCDVFAVVGCLGQHEAHAGALFALRALVFAFAAYAVMYSASASAAATAAAWEKSPAEEVDFLDIAPMPHVDHEIDMRLDRDFLLRARAVASLCELMATQRGLSLFGDDGPFPLLRTIIEDLGRCLDSVLLCADENARRMSNLVAQSLHGHPAGMEYLYLRSKTFQTRREGPLTLHEP